MKRRVFSFVCLCLLLGASIFVQSLPAFRSGIANRSRRNAGPAPAISAGLPTSVERKQRILATYRKSPLGFEANLGQTDPRVKFLARGGAYTLFLTSKEAVLAFGKTYAGEKLLAKLSNKALPLSKSKSKSKKFQSVVLHVKLVGANSSAQVVGIEELPRKTNYFIGNDPKKWRTNVSIYSKVKYKDVYPGVDLVYYGNQGKLEHDFVVSPGANPRVIRLAIGQAREVYIDSQGNLVVGVSRGEIHFEKPVVYQESKGSKHTILGRYVLTERRQVGFEVAAYDRSKSLVIDPVLSYSTYLGGSDTDIGFGIAVDSSGNAYVAGRTASTNFPVASPLQSSCGAGCAQGSRDAFVTKLNPEGSAVIYSTYLGGSGDDAAKGIAVDSSGNAYLTGVTQSLDFPLANPIQGACGGCPIRQDAFIAKLNPTGSALLYSTYLGGSGDDAGQGIAVDISGNAYITGISNSSDFPTTVGAFRTFGLGPFVTKLNVAGSALIYSTFLGSLSGGAIGNGIAVDSLGNAYVTGHTQTGFPTTAGAFQTTFRGDLDSFVAKLNPTGSSLLYATYLGGSGEDIGFHIAVDSSGNAYVTGRTASVDFPTANAIQVACMGCSPFGSRDAFVTKLNSDGSALIYSTYLGGSGDDQGAAIAVDSFGNAYVTGSTESADFPIVNPFAAFGGGRDPFLVKFDPAGSILLSSHLGGGDAAFGIALDSFGSVYVAGQTFGNTPVTQGVFQPKYGGNVDAFAAKIGFNRPPVANAGADQIVECTNPNGTPVTLNGSQSNDPDGDPLSFVWTDSNGDVVGTTATINRTLPLGLFTFNLTVTDPGGLSSSAVMHVTVRDTTPPTLMLSTDKITVTLATASATGRRVSLAAVASASDQCDPNPTITNNAPVSFPIGLTTVTFTAADHSGNSTEKQLTVQVVYNFIGYLPPILNGAAVFQSGRTIPVKFQLAAADGTLVTNAVANLQVFQVQNTPTGTVNVLAETTASGSSNTGTLFRFDPTSNQYIYNLSTSGDASGTYLLRTTLNDKTTHDVLISVK